jgi:hypothetical protein
VPRAANVSCLDVCEPPVHRPPLLKSPTWSPRASRDPPRAAIEAASASSLLAHSHTRPTPVVAPLGLVGTFPLICCRVPPCSSPEQGSPQLPKSGAAEPLTGLCSDPYKPHNRAIGECRPHPYPSPASPTVGLAGIRRTAPPPCP